VTTYLISRPRLCMLSSVLACHGQAAGGTGAGGGFGSSIIEREPSESVTLELTMMPALPAHARWGASVAFDAVSLALPPVAVSQDAGAGQERLLLVNVTGFIPPSSMFALMGSRCVRPAAFTQCYDSSRTAWWLACCSGAGKSTLLDVVSMRRSTGRLSGRVLIDGLQATRPMLKRVTAYVQQDDALCGWCSIEETLLFTASRSRAGLRRSLHRR